MRVVSGLIWDEDVCFLINKFFNNNFKYLFFMHDRGETLASSKRESLSRSKIENAG